jgi:Zn-dependent membrane protease YugP
MGSAFLIGLIFMGIGMFVSWRLKRKFNEYSQIPLRANLTGREVAEQMLRDYRIYDVAVTCVEGQLTDHYNPYDKTVNLSPDVYYGRSAAAVAVAAHECGHAVQHATAYSMLEFRSAIVPLQNISATVINTVSMIMIFGSIFASNILPFSVAIYIIIACYTIFTLFAFVTLPVEFDASKRALAWARNSRVVNSQEHEMAKDALKWAAMTYVVAALGSLAQLLYYVSLLAGRRD